MILTYNDSEVNRFHPIVEKCLKKTLEQLHLNDKYEVAHHQFVKNIEMDFVIRNKETRKSLCVVEVKRTPAAVKSQRYQLQAKSYVDMMSASQIEKPYFILTNIECSYLFKNKKEIPQVYKQIIKPGLVNNVSFNEIESEKELIEKTTEHYKHLIEKVVNDYEEYEQSLDDIVENLIAAKDNYEVWKSNFARMAYEYIRGAIASSNGNFKINDIRQYSQNIDSLRENFKRIDFEGIFNCPEYANSAKLENKLLKEIYDTGRKETDADELVTALHHIISLHNKHLGEVPTDLELARIMLVLAKQYCKTLKGCVCDPAAGSGNLISCVNEAYPDIQPKQIKANDKNELLLQLLSLRIGLKNVCTITPNNAPHITSLDIADLPMEYFDDVELIIMNPPMVSAVTDSYEKRKLYATLDNPKTDVGQAPLESAFLEYIYKKCKNNTTIVSLLPKTHLTATGGFAIALRKFLIEDFGLSLIFEYPSKGIFKDVTKATVAIVGKKGVYNDNIISLSTVNTIPDVNINTIERLLKEATGGQNIDGVEYNTIKRTELVKDVETGWKHFNSLKIETKNFIDQYLADTAKTIEIGNLKNIDLHRGKVGNNGLTDIIFPERNKNFQNLPESIRGKLCAGMRNAKHNSIETGKGDTKFLSVDKLTSKETSQAIRTLSGTAKRNGKQQRKQKSYKEMLEILHNEDQNSESASSILIPRNLRAIGRVFVCTEDTFVSTNFFVLSGLSEEKAKLYASWMSTIFYQICCEYYSKNQEGTRKMEKKEILKTPLPLFENLSDKQKNEIICQGTFQNFLNLKMPQIRNSDIVWAKIMFGEEWESILQEAKDLITRLANTRDPE